MSRVTASQVAKKNPLIQSMLKGDRRALARLMTYVDNHHEDGVAIMREVYKHGGHAYRIGITGPPGSGKSTLVDKIIKQYRQQGKTVGVVAIDPSSPFSGGAVLGDRIRMQDHGGDEGVFIRSLGSRGSHGGLSRATREVVQLLDAFGFDIILIETVGVGQTELDIMSVAHTTVVVLVPESGDTIQTMKAGLMEIADIFVVNKADREGAARIFGELQAMAEMATGKAKIPVLKVEAVRNKGVEELVQNIAAHAAAQKKQPKNILTNLLKEECLDVVWGELHKILEKQFDKLNKISNPYEAATQILEGIKLK